MVKLLYTSLLSFTLTTSLALALPYTHGLDHSDVLERDLDEEFSGREYLMDASDDIAAREPNFLDVVSGGLAVADKGLAVADKGIKIADKVANNPIVQAVAPLIPYGSDVLAAEKVASKVVSTAVKVEGDLKKGVNAMKRAEKTAVKVEGALKKGVKAIKKAEQSNRKLKHPNLARGSAIKATKNINKVVKQEKQARQTVSPRKSSRPTAKRLRRRDLEDIEELVSRRDFDAEEFLVREYDDFLAERDFFDHLD